MWQAFVTGFATQASKEIEERHKELQEQINSEMERNAVQNLEAKKKASKEAETRAGLAREINAVLSGASNIDADKKKQIAYEMVMNPEAGKSFLEGIKEGRIGVNDVGDFIQLPKAQEGVKPKELPEDITELFKARPREGVTRPDYSETRGAFGLPMAGAAERARTNAMAKLRMTEEEAGGLEYTPPTPTEGVTFNYQSLLKERTDTIDKRINTASIKVLDAETEEDRKTALSELNKVLAVKSLQKQATEGGTGAKESDVRSNYRILSNTIMESLAGPGDLVRDNETGAFIYSKTAPPEVRAKIEQQKRQAFMSSDLTKSYRFSDGSLPPEVSRVISSFIYSTDSGAKKETTKTFSGDIEREKSLAYSAIAAAKGNEQAVANIRRKFKEKTGQDLL